MLDKVTHVDEIYRFKNILDNFQTSLIILKKKLNFEENKFTKQDIIFKRFFFKSSNLLNGKLKNIFFLVFKFLVYLYLINSIF